MDKRFEQTHQRRYTNSQKTHEKVHHIISLVIREIQIKTTMIPLPTEIAKIKK